MWCCCFLWTISTFFSFSRNLNSMFDWIFKFCLHFDSFVFLPKLNHNWYIVMQKLRYLLSDVWRYGVRYRLNNFRKRSIKSKCIHLPLSKTKQSDELIRSRNGKINGFSIQVSWKNHQHLYRTYTHVKHAIWQKMLRHRWLHVAALKKLSQKTTSYKIQHSLNTRSSHDTVFCFTWY